MEKRYAISACNVTKYYGNNHQALNGISLDVKWGEIYGFLGPNGAGKSTLIQILTTLMLPTDGSVSVAGYDVVHQADLIRQSIGVALQDTGVDAMLTGRELLHIQARLFGFSRLDAKARANELLRQFGLEDAGDNRIKSYSGGMRRRLDLALALVHHPPIVFLDEPTTGLDPVNRIGLWKLLQEVQHQTGVTVFLTTQYLEEADALCDNIGIINHGQIVAEDTPQTLKRRLKRDVIELEPEHEADIERLSSLLQQNSETVRDRNLIRVFTPHGASTVTNILNQVAAAHIELASLKVAPPTLDDVFLELTGFQSTSENPTIDSVRAVGSDTSLL
ncbi:ATP-binding cassette domain-containing protein [Alicyclobacillus mengziensis]|uniref:ATP-binding cassette domain-containing protein n=1 Tax=Alicyclobacillus mengziensis TaxID=2931921 RepID=A0A9X7VY51_9BACL|nr:ATP-binding cassette domain-containing protein [Alicyclobacillus mengziensis]QSO47231.1 ATP-binding cassette domain-containing protein [Alicyclobacillus mengziensis]